MEAWREELYHFGIKGMKWKKRKRNMSNLEAQARLAEGATRQANEAAQEYLSASKAGLKGSLLNQRYKNMKTAYANRAKADGALYRNKKTKRELAAKYIKTISKQKRKSKKKELKAQLKKLLRQPTKR